MWGAIDLLVSVEDAKAGRRGEERRGALAADEAFGLSSLSSHGAQKSVGVIHELHACRMASIFSLTEPRAALPPLTRVGELSRRFRTTPRQPRGDAAGLPARPRRGRVARAQVPPPSTPVHAHNANL